MVISIIPIHAHRTANKALGVAQRYNASVTGGTAVHFDWDMGDGEVYRAAGMYIASRNWKMA